MRDKFRSRPLRRRFCAAVRRMIQSQARRQAQWMRGGESAAAGCGTGEGVCKVPAVQGPMVGGGTDEHGCLVAAGQSFSEIKNGCVQVFDVADVRLHDPDNATLAIYGIFSADKSKVEIFWSSLPESVILRAKGSGYVSKDGKISLLKSGKGYKIRRK